jgi:hypothetical protein
MAAQQWLANCDNPDQVEHIVVTHEPFFHMPPVFPRTRFLVNRIKGSVPSWNYGATFADGAFFIGMADDLLSCPHWDSRLMEFPPDLDSAYVIEVDHADCSNLLTHIFCSRDYYKRFRYMHHPDYVHLMADVEFTDVARASGLLVNKRHLTFPHLNPEKGTIAWEPRYHRVRNEASEYEQAKALYARRKAAGFPKTSVLEIAC